MVPAVASVVGFNYNDTFDINQCRRFAFPVLGTAVLVISTVYEQSSQPLPSHGSKLALPIFILTVHPASHRNPVPISPCPDIYFLLEVCLFGIQTAVPDSSRIRGSGVLGARSLQLSADRFIGMLFYYTSLPVRYHDCGLSWATAQRKWRCISTVLRDLTLFSAANLPTIQ